MAQLPLFIFIIISLGFSQLVYSNPKTNPTVIPKGPSIAANSYIMIDYNSGKVLAEKNSQLPVSPESITKVMTDYVVFNELRAGNIKLDDLVTISKKAWKTEGSRMFVEVNRKVSVENLLQGMIIQSGNDASVALAEHVAGSEETFAALMNQYARRLGMKNTHFKNSTGLPDEEHLTTAQDLSILSKALISSFPEYYKWYSTKEFTFNKIKQHNRNQLLWRDKSVDGIKTGHTKSAGYCLLASSKRENMRIISVVLGTDSKSARAAETQKLLNFGFRFYENHVLYKKNTALKQLKVFKGAQNDLDVGLEEDMYVTIPRGQYKNLKPSINIREKIIAPISKGEHLGDVEIKLNNEILIKKPLVALHDIREGSFWQRGKDSIILMFK
jgi:D-alanyl-D-alanine carboxypeptidase (penicillin-binding protein 5/6)